MVSLSSPKGTDSSTIDGTGDGTDMDEVEDEDVEEEDTLDGVPKSCSLPEASADVAR